MGMGVLSNWDLLDDSRLPGIGYVEDAGSKTVVAHMADIQRIVLQHDLHSVSAAVQIRMTNQLDISALKNVHVAVPFDVKLSSAQNAPAKRSRRLTAPPANQQTVACSYTGYCSTNESLLRTGQTLWAHTPHPRCPPRTRPVLRPDPTRRKHHL